VCCTPRNISREQEHSVSNRIYLLAMTDKRPTPSCRQSPVKWQYPYFLIPRYEKGQINELWLTLVASSQKGAKRGNCSANSISNNNFYNSDTGGSTKKVRRGLRTQLLLIAVIGQWKQDVVDSGPEDYSQSLLREILRNVYKLRLTRAVNCWTEVTIHIPCFRVHQTLSFFCSCCFLQSQNSELKNLSAYSIVYVYSDKLFPRKAPS
jgi:hypothetical protein